MRKLVTLSVLGAAAWLALCLSWAVVSHLTGIPGPARVASAAIYVTADAVDAVVLPAPIAGPQRAVSGRLRASGRLVEGVYRAPERLARRLASGLGFDRRWAPRRTEYCRASIAPEKAEVEQEIRIRLESRLQSPLWRLEQRLGEVRHHLERQLSEAERRHLLSVAVLRPNDEAVFPRGAASLSLAPVAVAPAN